jgi:hypothetical protein
MPGSPLDEAATKIMTSLEPLDANFRARVINKLSTRYAPGNVGRRKEAETELAHVQRTKRALADMIRLESGPRLARIATTQLHDLKAEKNMLASPLGQEMGPWPGGGWEGVLVLEHDWAAAFAKAGGDDLGAHEVRLPYDTTLLELRACGMHVVVFLFSDTVDGQMSIFCRNADGWFFSACFILMLTQRIGFLPASKLIS